MTELFFVSYRNWHWTSVVLCSPPAGLSQGLAPTFIHSSCRSLSKSNNYFGIQNILNYKFYQTNVYCELLYNYVIIIVHIKGTEIYCFHKYFKNTPYTKRLTVDGTNDGCLLKCIHLFLFLFLFYYTYILHAVYDPAATGRFAEHNKYREQTGNKILYW